MIYGLLGAVRAAGLRPVGIDLSAFAMIRALHTPDRAGGVLYVNVGGITTLAVADGLNCLFTRTTAPGLESMAEDLAERRGVTLLTARSWLHRGGIEEPLGHGGESAAAVLDARSSMMTGIARIADDIRNTLAFQLTQLQGVAVERAIVTGAAAGINGFADALSGELGLPTEVGVVRESGLLAFGGLPPTSLTVAAGLTVEDVA
jgi:type IV pilus assembly protein PilM